MSDHLPECIANDVPTANFYNCICDRLRQAEQRGFEGTPDIDDRLAAVYREGYAAGVTAGVAEGVKSGREGALADAREAVAAELSNPDCPCDECSGIRAAIVIIDALRGSDE